MIRKFSLIIIVLAILLVSGCGPAAPDVGPEEEETEEIMIGVANFLLGAPYFVAMSDAAEEEGAFYKNVTVVTTDGQADAEKITSDIEDLIAQGADGILVNAGPIEALPAAMDSINDAAIPVVMVDRKLTGSEYDSWIGPDNFHIGEQVGSYIVDRLGGEGMMVVIRGGPEDNTIGLARTNGVMSQVEETGIEVVMAPDFGGWGEDGGFTIMEDMLAVHDQIDAVFCENDSMCLGAQKAIEDSGRSDEMFICGVDGQKEALEAIMADTNYACTGKNDSDEIGRAGFHRLLGIMAGAEPEKDTVLPSPLITSENAARYYDPDSLF